MMHLLSANDLSKDAISRILDIADRLAKDSEDAGIKEHAVLTMFFEKPSTRTRLSFEAAIAQLGGSAVYIDPSTSQRSRGETLADTAKMLSLYSDFIAARLYKHGDLKEIAKNATVPVINALTDIEHPTQALADIYTVRAHKKLKGLRIAFVGDIANNTATSLMITAAKLGIEVVLVGPKDCKPNPWAVTAARGYAKIVVTDSLEEGLEDADIIYTDTFVSMGEEKETEGRKKLFAPYQVNSKAVGYAKKDALVMHCLPAHRGEEITGDVLDGPKSIAVEQAGNKLLINKAILVYLSQKQ